MGICHAEEKQKKMFFNMEKEQYIEEAGQFQNMKMKIKLEFTITGIQKGHRYQIQTTFPELNDKFETETVKCHGNIITFNTCNRCFFYFEKQQIIQVFLIKDSIQEGSIIVSLGRIIGSYQKPFESPIGSKGTKIMITAEEIKDFSSYIEFIFEVQKVSLIDFFVPRNRFTYLITSNERKVYSSESISINGEFAPVKIPINLIINGFTITFIGPDKSCLNYKDETIGSFNQSKGQLLLGLTINNKKVNIINKSNLIHNFSFIDYIKKGVTIKLSIGIDYTSSNKLPNDPSSLHFLGGENDYEKAIKACGLIIAYYDYNQLFPVYGFGAIIENEKIPNMCFNVNFKNNPEIYTIDNVIYEYHNSFKHLVLAGPTNFAPKMKQVIGYIRRENNILRYNVLLILTDGIITDMNETIDTLVEASFLPLSVVIIGIGNDHFEEMKILDGNENPLINSKGEKRLRDLAQFIPFNNYKNNPNLLAEEVLKEIPRQIIEYYTINHITPNHL